MSESSDDGGPIVTYSDTQVKCIVCNVLIPNTDLNMEQHLIGNKHTQNNIAQIMSQNGISLDDEESYCKLCKDYFPYTTVDIQEHAFSDSHISLLEELEQLVDAEFVNLDAYLSSGKQIRNVHCDVCDCNVSCSYSCLDQHIRGYNHMSARSAKLMPMNGVFNTTAGDEKWCKLCDKYFDNTFEDILSHIDYDENHIYHRREFEDLIEDEQISICKFLSELNYHQAYCSKCKVVIPCTPQNLEEHIEGYRHST